MFTTIALAAILLCSGNIRTNTGSKQYVNIILKNISNESLEMELSHATLILEYDKMFTYSAPLDEFGSVVQIRLAKHSGKAHYLNMNRGSDRELRSAGSGWLSCTKL